jgi:hypothetical protein
MLIIQITKMINRTNQTKKDKIDDPGGTKAPDTKMTKELIITEKKPPCDVCGSMTHGLRVTRSGVGDSHGVNFFCPVATREEMRSDQLEPCPNQIAKYYQYDETSLSLVFRDMRDRGYGRFVTSDAMDIIENQTREICQGNSDTSLPKRRKIIGEEPGSQPTLSSDKNILHWGRELNKG